MKSKASSRSSACSTRCREAYEACTRTREHESVCRMQRAQCSCNCS